MCDPRQNDIGLGDARDCQPAFASQTLADFRHGVPFAIGEPPAWLQTSLPNAVLGRQVLILQQEFLIDPPGNVGQSRAHVVAFVLDFHHRKP
jgi:hypothetical protein